MTKKSEERKRLEELRSIEAFAECTIEELARIDSLLTEATFPAGSVLIEEGTPGFEFLVLVEGTARVTRGGKPVATVGPGSFVGEMALLAKDEPTRSASVTAETKLRAFVLNAGEFAALLNESQTMREKILRTKSFRSHPAGKRR